MARERPSQARTVANLNYIMGSAVIGRQLERGDGFQMKAEAGQADWF